MRYNELITEANYRGKFDTATVFNNDADFKKAIKTKFGADGQEKKSKPLAGGAVYIIDNKLGIVGYRVPNNDSPSGYVWYAAKEPFMPATKGGKVEPIQPVQAAPKAEQGVTDYKVVPTDSHMAGKVLVSMSKLPLPPKASNRAIINFLRGFPALNSGGFNVTGPENGVLTIKSHKLTGEEIIATLEGKGKPVEPSPKAEKPVAPKAAPAELTPATDAELKNAVQDLFDTMTGWQHYQSNPPEKTSWGDWQADVRDWGSWEVPYDAEDDGDYDWKVLTDKSRKQLSAIIDQVSKRHPKVKLEAMTEEKNWLTLRASSKVKAK